MFNLCVDVLVRLFQRAVNQSLLQAVGVEGAGIHTLQFADDLLIFFDGSERAARIIKAILDAYSEASGLRINFAKSAIIPINLELHEVTGLSRLFGCEVNSFPFTYLGLPLSPRALRRADFLPLVEKVDKRMAGWKGLLLSRAGRLVLVNSVLSSIPAFFFSTFRVPLWAIKAIDNTRRSLFWKGKRLDNGFHCLVKWDQLCRPKQLGGLRVRNLRATNSSLLMKSFWAFYKGEALPWVKMLRNFHYKRRVPCAAGRTPTNCSPIWKGVLSTASAFHASTGFLLGDGKSTSFWHSRWKGDVLLRNSFPAAFEAIPLKHLSVKNWLRRRGSLPNFGVSSDSAPLNRELVALRTITDSVALRAEPDTITWRWSERGCFTVRSAYLFLMFDGVEDCRIPHLWRIKIPPKLKVFLWLAARNRLLTADQLTKRGWVGPSMCCMCGGDSETLEHLFFICPFAVEVWGGLLQNSATILGCILGSKGDLAGRWLRTRKLAHGRFKSLLDWGFAATCWELWLERNRRLFTGRSCTARQCAVQVQVTLATWSEVWRHRELIL